MLLTAISLHLENMVGIITGVIFIIIGQLTRETYWNCEFCNKKYDGELSCIVHEKHCKEKK